MSLFDKTPMPGDVQGVGQLYLEPQAYDAVLHLAVALRAYTARHDPTLTPAEQSWSRMCVQAGISGFLPPYPDPTSDYSKFALTDGYTMSLTPDEMQRLQFWRQMGLFETFVKRYLHPAQELAQEDLLIRAMLHEYRCEYSRMQNIVEMLRNAEEGVKD